MLAGEQDRAGARDLACRAVLLLDPQQAAELGQLPWLEIDVGAARERVRAPAGARGISVRCAGKVAHRRADRGFERCGAALAARPRT